MQNEKMAATTVELLDDAGKVYHLEIPEKFTPQKDDMRAVIGPIMGTKSGFGDTTAHTIKTFLVRDPVTGKFGCLVTHKNACVSHATSAGCKRGAGCRFYHAAPGDLMSGHPADRKTVPLGARADLAACYKAYKGSRWKELKPILDMADWSAEQEATINKSDTRAIEDMKEARARKDASASVRQYHADAYEQALSGQAGGVRALPGPEYAYSVSGAMGGAHARYALPPPGPEAYMHGYPHGYPRPAGYGYPYPQHHAQLPYAQPGHAHAQPAQLPPPLSPHTRVHQSIEEVPSFVEEQPPRKKAKQEPEVPEDEDEDEDDEPDQENDRLTALREKLRLAKAAKAQQEAEAAKEAAARERRRKQAEKRRARLAKEEAEAEALERELAAIEEQTAQIAADRDAAKQAEASNVGHHAQEEAHVPAQEEEDQLDAEVDMAADDEAIIGLSVLTQQE